ncbi:polyprenyl synthetase family protein [Streptomyces sp. NPDC018045]|uniref:polyprenyl synthetase family protein n=1 Tax=Streptomyces sp. NPDC018045 TaxID=3365037 RepID=UPI00378BFAD3
MSSTTARADDVIARLLPEVSAFIDRQLDDYPDACGPLRITVRTVIDQGRHERNETALPLLTHAAITGVPEPAVPVAAAHALWWRAANAFDDIADGDAGPAMYGIGTGPALMAALECGHGLPLRALAALDLPAALRERLVSDYLDGWTLTNDGQIRDLFNTAATADPQAVLTTYEHKSGSAYAMACGMTARIAGCDDAAVDAWRTFGHAVGTLLQFRNDEEELRDEREEDIRNGTATYRLVCALRQLSGEERQRALRLVREAADSPDGRAEIRAMLLDPAVQAATLAVRDGLLRRAHDLLDRLAVPSEFTTALRSLVDTAAARATPADRADTAADPGTDVPSPDTSFPDTSSARAASGRQSVLTAGHAEFRAN